MDNLKLVESCFRGLGLTRLQIRTIMEKVNEYISYNRMSGAFAENEEEGESVGLFRQC